MDVDAPAFVLELEIDDEISFKPIHKHNKRYLTIIASYFMLNQTTCQIMLCYLTYDSYASQGSSDFRFQCSANRYSRKEKTDTKNSKYHVYHHEVGAKFHTWCRELHTSNDDERAEWYRSTNTITCVYWSAWEHTHA